MKNFITYTLCLFAFYSISAQEVAVDSLYREDQFYIGGTFNLLFNKPEYVTQSGFSGGFHLGFIRDMPINKKRNLAFGVGVGYSFNVYNQNLLLRKNDAGETLFTTSGSSSFMTNRFTTHLIEMPLEFRWRTSTAVSHKFYRLYTGIRMGYLASFAYKYTDDSTDLRLTNFKELDKLRIGANLTFGWNTFNFYFYYSLNPLFNKALIEEDSIGFNAAKIGLMFYIL